MHYTCRWPSGAQVERGLVQPVLSQPEVRWARDLVCVMEVGRYGYMGVLLLYVYLI